MYLTNRGEDQTMWSDYGENKKKLTNIVCICVKVYDLAFL